MDRIYIPTLGRSDNQVTFDNMSQNAQQVTRLVVQPKEQHLYPNYPILVLPDNDIDTVEYFNHGIKKIVLYNPNNTNNYFD